MKKQEFLDKITEIGTCEDEVQRRTLLANLSEEASKDYDERDTLSTSNETLKNDNETLRQANMQLFLRVGKAKDDASNNPPTPQSPKPEPPEKLSFDNLFDEKGGLK